jgi:anti-sigma factor RsiW
VNTRAVIAGCRQQASHLRLRTLVGAYVDGELTGSQRARLAAHLTACWACSGYVETLRMIKQSLRRIDREHPTQPAHSLSRHPGR